MNTQYIPVLRVTCEDLTATGPEGEQFPLQPGGWVDFRLDLPWRATRVNASLPQREWIRQVMLILKRQVIDWNWKDRHGEPLPRPRDKPPEVEEGQRAPAFYSFEDALWDLRSEEREWLRTHYWDAGQAPNGQSSPSSET